MLGERQRHQGTLSKNVGFGTVNEAFEIEEGDEACIDSRTSTFSRKKKPKIISLVWWHYSSKSISINST